VLSSAPRHQDVWRSGCTDPSILEVGTSWRVVSFTPQYLLDRTLGETQGPSGHCGGENKTSLAPIENRTPTIQAAARRYTDRRIPAQS
jgi:hypothetical protein